MAGKNEKSEIRLGTGTQRELLRLKGVQKETAAAINTILMVAMETRGVVASRGWVLTGDCKRLVKEPESAIPEPEDAIPEPEDFKPKAPERKIPSKKGKSK